MKNFKVGDKVKLNDALLFTNPFYRGAIGTIIHYSDNLFSCRIKWYSKVNSY